MKCIREEVSKSMLLGREEGFWCEIHVDGTQLEQISEFKYLGCVLNKSGTDDVECCRKVACRWKVADDIICHS